MKLNRSLHIWPTNLSGYLDGEISPVKSRRIERHLAKCQACTATLDGLRRVQVALYAMKASRTSWNAPLPSWAAIEVELHSRPMPAPFFVRYGLQMAGAAGSALLLAFALYYYLPRSAPPADMAVARFEPSDLYQYVGDRLFAPEKVLLGDTVAIRPELEEAVFPEKVYFHDRNFS
jgi:anti-sigma factor RsiW